MKNEVRILYLCLKNFVGIYNGLGLKALELDMRECTHKYILLAGANGSGKSTILNALNPFSGVDNSGDRAKFIREGKKGYKEIHITDYNNLYIIKHFYEPSTKSHTVKSYMTKVNLKTQMENELNPNGNVTSFNELVLIELGISSDFMNIMALSSNMKGLITMKATERKNYATKFTAESQMYLKLFKKMNDDCRLVKGLIHSVTDKLDKMDDIFTVRNEIDSIESKLNNLNSERDRTLSVINGSIGRLSVIDSSGELVSMSETIEEDINYTKVLIKNINSNKPKIFTATNDEAYLNKLLYDTLIDLNNKLNLLESAKSHNISLLNRLADTEDSISQIEAQLITFKSENTLDDTRNMCKKYSDMIAYYERVLSDDTYHTTLTKSELLLGYSTLNVINENITTIHDKIPYHILQNILITDSETIHKEYIKTQTVLEKYKSDYNGIQLTMSKNEGAIQFAKSLENRPSNCNNDSCPFIVEALNNLNSINEYNELQNELNKMNTKINETEEHLKELNYFIDAFAELKNIDKIIGYNIEVLQGMPEAKILEKNYLYKVIANNKKLYDEEDMVKYIEYSENQQAYIELKNIKLPMMLKELKLLESNKIIVDNLHDNLKSLNKKRDDILEQLSVNKATIEDLTTKSISLQTQQSDLKCYYESVVEENKYTKILNDLVEKFEANKKTIEQINQLKSIINHNKNLIDEIDDMIKDLTKRRDKQMFQYKQIKKFNKEKDILEENYKDIEVLTRALSASKGIPTVFVKIYLEQTRIIANSLLKHAFGGKLTIDNFEINEKEFKIPCSGKGEKNSDVSSASDGEKAIIGLSLSCALIKQNSTKYNVLQLDELDAPLDKKHRKLFQHLLDKQTETLGIEQVFLTSHNDAYSNEDIGLILLKDHDIDNYNKKNVIYEY